jgi:dTDP-4-amino-4,6-dideoxygalactose transaminase
VFTNVNNPRAFVERKNEYRKTIVRRGSSIGANATVVCGHEIGEYAFVGAGSVVTRDVAAYALVVGNPARRTGWMCRCGVKLPPPEASGGTACDACKLRYIESAGRLALDETAVELARPKRVPMLDLAAQHEPLNGALRQAFERVLASNSFIMGADVDAFEREVAAYLGANHAIGVSSGTDALLVALMALDIGPGDEVVVPTFSFFATAGAVSRTGATPVFVDVDPLNANMTLAGFVAAITQRTKAVIPVHLFGEPAPVVEIVSEARRRGIFVIEDAAQALGARLEAGAIGTIGDIGCYSFFPSKNLGALGDAGLVATQSPELAARIRRLRVHGAEPKYFHQEIGGNFRLDALQAAFLRVKLPHLDRWTAARRKNADLYDELLGAAGLPREELGLPSRSKASIVNQYNVQVRNRDSVREFLRERGIATEIYYPRPLHLQQCYASAGLGVGALPDAERLAERSLALPIYPELPREALIHTAETLLAALKHA